MKKLIFLPFLLLIGLLSLSSCESEEGDESSNKSSLPIARGEAAEIILAIDSAKWNGPVGDVLKDIFYATVPGNFRDENLFTLRRVDPVKMNSVLQSAHSLVYVTTLDSRSAGSRRISSLFSKESIERIVADSSLFINRRKDQFARGQEVLYLFGKNDAELIKNLKQNKDKLREVFNNNERLRLEKKLYAATPERGIMNKVEDKFGVQIKIPRGYKIASESDNFLWIRQLSPNTYEPDKNLYFYETDYYSEEQLFPSSLIDLRDQIGQENIFGDPARPNTYMKTEKEILPSFKNLQINGNFASEIRGAWRTNEIIMGGSFISYAIVDAEKGKIYFIEGFVYFPNEPHRELMREFETIIKTAKIVKPKTEE